MKKILFSLFLLSASVCGLIAQKTIEKGSVTMKVELDGPMAAMMGESSVTTHFSEKKFCYKMKFMAGLFSMTIVNNGEGAGIMLMDAPMMGKRIAVETTKKDLNDVADANNLDEMKYVYNKKKTKKILNFKCYQVLMSKPGSDEAAEIWVTDQINIQNDIKKQFKGLKGFPMEYEINVQGGIKMKFTATEISKNDPDEKHFSTEVPAGFEKKTLEEFEKEMGGMKGMGM